MYRYAAEQIHNEEQQEDAAHSNAHNGSRGEYLTIGNLDDIDTCSRERERRPWGKREEEKARARDSGWCVREGERENGAECV